MKKGKSERKAPAKSLHPLMLYEASVQNPAEAVSFVTRLFRENSGRKPIALREDFCGSSAFACEWVRSDRKRTAVGLDLDQTTLEWAREHNLPTLGKAVQRVTLLNRDVRSVTAPPVDVVTAFNFSYCVFKQRAQMKAYYRSVHDSLVDDGAFIFDLFGGTQGMNTTYEERRIAGRIRPDGTKIPSFKYGWEHAHFNVVNHDIHCHIDFKLKGQPKMRRVFSYDWRLWTIPELADLLHETGFSRVETYLHGWTDDGESDEKYRKTKVFENSEGWLAYIVAVK
jgi:hypothetical protein